MRSNSRVSALVGTFFGLMAIIVYSAAMESSKLQATLGKRAMSIKVTDVDGRRISFGRALARFSGKILSYLTFWIGFIMAGFTEKRQGLHDMIAGTLVTCRPGEREANPTSPS